MRLRSLGAALGLALLAACQSRPPAPTPVPRPIPPPPRPAVPPGAPEYVAEFNSLELFVAKACEIALRRPLSAPTRALVERLQADHRGLSAQLAFAGRRLVLLPGSTMRPREARMLDELYRAPDFERQLVTRMRAVHQRTVTLHDSFANAGSSPTLRLVARHAVSIERGHLDELTR